MKTVKIGILLPHEIFAHFYHYQNGDLFYAIMTGTPDESCQEAFVPQSFRIVVPIPCFHATQDLETYWKNNADLASTLRDHWGSEALKLTDTKPCNFLKCLGTVLRHPNIFLVVLSPFAYMGMEPTS